MDRIGCLRVAVLLMPALTPVGYGVAFAASPQVCKVHFAAVHMGGAITIAKRDGSSVSGILTSTHGDVAEITPADSKQAVTISCGEVASVVHGAMDPVKLRQMLLKRGIGKRVEVLELGGAAVAGKLTAIHDDGFEIEPEEKGAPVAIIPYSQVSLVENYSKAGSFGNSVSGRIYLWMPLLVVGYIAAQVVVLVR